MTVFVAKNSSRLSRVLKPRFGVNAPRSIAFLEARLATMIGQPDLEWRPGNAMGICRHDAWVLPNPSGLIGVLAFDALVRRRIRVSGQRCSAAPRSGLPGVDMIISTRIELRPDLRGGAVSLTSPTRKW